MKFSPDVVPIFDKTLLGSIRRPIEPMKWDIVLDFYDRGLYKDVIIGILDYVDSELVSKRGNPAKTDFVIPHGSAIVKIKIDDKNFHVTAPFLEVPSTHNIPLLRQVSEINLFPLNLSTIVLENNQLIFKYSCPLEMCEPYKIYDVLREICRYADAYDDDFIKKFNARWIHRPVIRTFAQKYTDYAWNRVQFYIQEASAYIDYLERKRLIEFCLDMMVITLMKIDYYAVPQGAIMTEIERAVSQLQDNETPINDRIRKGREILSSLKNHSKQEFTKDLYVAEVFIPLRLNFTNEMVEPYFQRYYEVAKKEMAAREYLGAVLTLQSAFIGLFYNYIFPEDIKELITTALVQSNHKPWDKAASVLWQALENVLQRQTPKRKRGFLRTLFGSMS
ncbi:MAG: hypothetical protein PVH61_33350 [Candidatus Aminicenantes bacterium]